MTAACDATSHNQSYRSASSEPSPQKRLLQKRRGDSPGLKKMYNELVTALALPGDLNSGLCMITSWLTTPDGRQPVKRPQKGMNV